MPYRQPTATTTGSATTQDPKTYNLLQPSASAKRTWRTGEAERLAAYPTQYEYAAVIDFNRPARPRSPGTPTYGEYVTSRPVNVRLGSAIFLHINGKGSTAGCVSISRADMISVLQVARPGQEAAHRDGAAGGDRHGLKYTPPPAGLQAKYVGPVRCCAYRDRHVRARSAAAPVGGSRVRALRRRRYPKLTLPQPQQNPGEGWLRPARFWRGPLADGRALSSCRFLHPVRTVSSWPRASSSGPSRTSTSARWGTSTTARRP